MREPKKDYVVTMKAERKAFGGITGAPKGEKPQGGVTPSVN